MTRARKERRKLPNWVVGLGMILLVVVCLFLAFSKRIPFIDRGYEVNAVFANAQNLAENSPVRIAGVNVGKVSKVEPMADDNAAVVTMTISNDGQPIHEDARIQVRPRLFLEGNYFVDIRPGSPSSPELPDNGEIPIQQTSGSVQLDQVLSTLQSNVRGNLQILLKELGDGLQKYGGADGLREFNRTGAPAYKNTALVNVALLGTQEGDLSGVVRNFDRVVVALNRNQDQLKDLVTNLRIVTGSFAAQDTALASSIHQLPGVLSSARPVFDNLNASFPAVRAFAREALPGVRSTEGTIDVALPFVRQLRLLVSPPELRGLTADLRPTIPSLARLTRAQIPFMEQLRPLSSCFTHVIVPWGYSKTNPVELGGKAVGPVYQETGYGLVGIGGESRSGDANGQYVRVIGGGGTNTVVLPPAFGLPKQVGTTAFPLLGAQPTLTDSAKTKFKPKAPCENQDPPNLNSEVGPPPARQGSVSRKQLSVLSDPAFDGSVIENTSQRGVSLYTDMLRFEQMDPKSAEAKSLRESLKRRIEAYRKDGVYADYRKAVLALGRGDVLQALDTADSAISDAGTPSSGAISSGVANSGVGSSAAGASGSAGGK